MTEMQALPENHPKLKKWKRFQRTEEYKNARRWAAFDEHLDGSLWYVFDEGFESGIDIERQRSTDALEQEQDKYSACDANWSNEVLDLSERIEQLEAAFDAMPEPETVWPPAINNANEMQLWADIRDWYYSTRRLIAGDSGNE